MEIALERRRVGLAQVKSVFRSGSFPLHFTGATFILKPVMNLHQLAGPIAVDRWTVGSILQWATGRLRTNGCDEATLHAELLLGYALACSRHELTRERDRVMSAAEIDVFASLIDRRVKHEPLQYIMGETDFMGLPLYVDPGVLIPRPETEFLVEKTLEVINGKSMKSLQVLDIGTGSGNIAIALAHFAPLARITSIDVSSAALRTAARNIARHSIESISLEKMDVFSDVMPGRMFDVIVSNPPYVSTEEFETLQPEVREYEPRIATTDGGDGLRFIRRVSELSAMKLNTGGTVLLEISYNQSVDAVKILGESGLRGIDLFEDFAGIPRVIKGSRWK
jgi:release factor glutamine methyltransferase